MFYIVYLRFFFIYWPCIIIFLRDDCFTVFCDILGTFLVHLKGKHLKWRDCQYYFEHYFTSNQVASVSSKSGSPLHCGFVYAITRRMMSLPDVISWNGVKKDAQVLLGLRCCDTNCCWRSECFEISGSGTHFTTRHHLWVLTNRVHSKTILCGPCREKKNVYKCFTLKIVSDFEHCPVVYGSQWMSYLLCISVF